ncbi:hypothetical protein L208DRAFT_1382626 [Tricholoma matsutake]|nr:hypothetical protein L208DRAFT_1382626 [Tricholoma matsutake 945]
MSPSALISSGIDLEAAQHTLGVEAGKIWAHVQDCQCTKFQLQSNALHHKINAWSTKQQLYMLGIAVLCAADAKTTAPRLPYLIPLWLPSQISTKIPLNHWFAEIEWQLHIGQAYKSLELLRGTLQIHSHLFQFKDHFVRGQATNTRALEADVLEIMEGEEGVSEGRRRLSWIWKTIVVAGLEENEGLQDGLHIKWCKSQAWAMHFMEEVELLQEEMEHVLCFLQWQENWWRMKGQCEGWGPLSKIWIEALRCYAEHQAALH